MAKRKKYRLIVELETEFTKNVGDEFRDAAGVISHQMGKGSMSGGAEHNKGEFSFWVENEKGEQVMR